MSGVMPKKCPACGEDMDICLLRCPDCLTEVQGEFSQNRFSRLSEEHLSFLEVFIRCRGSLKDLGTRVGISYPTARNRLDALIAALGFDEDIQKDTRARRLNILEKLKNGEISAEDALNELQGGKKDA